MANQKPAKLFASICLYGTRVYGFYCLSQVSDGRQFGKMPELGGAKYDSATEAIWHADRDLLDAGLAYGTPVAIHMDRSEDEPVVALAELGSIPTFGDLKFGPGTTVAVRV